MPEIRHLSKAPITEAAINFQVDASQQWDAETVRDALGRRWANCPQVQELRPVRVQIQIAPAGPVAQPALAPAGPQLPIQGFIFRGQTAIYQARRDGFTFTRLAPYQNWNSLISDAFDGWDAFQELLRPRELHAVSIRFLNRLQFDLPEFSPSRYFTVPPKTPPNLQWRLHGFHEQAVYAPPDSPCLVTVQTMPAFVADPANEIAFVLTIEVILTQSLPALGRPLDSVLSEMHALKNDAFFNLLTEEAIQRYV
jgi:uncharacterized protein (TIGR04255 family)